MHVTSVPQFSLNRAGTMLDLEEGTPGLPAPATSTPRAATHPVPSALRLELPRPRGAAEIRQQTNALAADTDINDAPIREPIGNSQRSNLPVGLALAGMGLIFAVPGAVLLGVGLRHGVPHHQKFVWTDPDCYKRLGQFADVGCPGSWQGDASQNVAYRMMVSGAILVAFGGTVVMSSLCCCTGSQESQPTGATSGSPSDN